MRTRGIASTQPAGWVLLLALAICLLVAPSAEASPSRLDPSFGDRGKVTTPVDLGSWKEALVRVATAEDGSVVVASANQLLRYLPDGRLDRHFGVDGKLALTQLEGLSLGLDDIDIDSRGRIVAFGTAYDPTVSRHVAGYWTGAYVRPTFAVVLRFSATGQLDPSFGGGDGIVRTDLGIASSLQPEDGNPPPSLVRGMAGEVDSQDRPVLLVALYEFSSGAGHSYARWLSRGVARLTPSGDLDPSFDGDGALLLNGENRGVIGTPDDRPLVWGTQASRLYADGAIDAGYGSGGTTALKRGAGALALDKRGRLLILEPPDAEASHVTRLNEDGSLDSHFGRSGRVAVKPPAPGASLSSIAVGPGGRVLVAGTAPGRHRSERANGKPAAALILGCLLPSGLTDRRVGRGGWIQSRFGRDARLSPAREVGTEDGVRMRGPEAAFDAAGRLVVVDAARSSLLDPSGIVLARYLLGP